MKLLALDPSITNFGWCVGCSDDGWSAVDAGCIKTRSQASQSGVGETEDQTRRIRYISQGLCRIMADYDVDLVASEYQPGWTSMKTAKTSGMIISLVVCNCMHSGDLPLEWYQPSEVKKVVLGKRSGTKKEIRQEMLEHYPRIEGMFGGTKYQTEAVGDATSVLHCAVQSSELVKALS